MFAVVCFFFTVTKRIRVISVTGVSVIIKRSRNQDDSVTNYGQYGYKIFDPGLFGHKSEYKEV